MIARADTMRLRPFSALVPTLATGQWTDHGRALYAVRLLAARMMLFAIIEARPSFTHAVLAGGVLGLHQGSHPTLPSWPLSAPEVPAMLVASVAMGMVYPAWPAAIREALATVGAASPRCEACRLSGGDGEVVSRAQGGFDDYPAHITHACTACGNGWTETGAEQ